MSRDQFENGELVIDGRGNKGQVFKFWHDRESRYYFRVRLIDGPLRLAGKMWVSVVGWRGLVDYADGTIEQRCCRCGRDFRSPLPLAPGEEFCLRCAGEPIEKWLKDFSIRSQAYRMAQESTIDELRKKGA